MSKVMKTTSPGKNFVEVRDGPSGPKAGRTFLISRAGVRPGTRLSTTKAARDCLIGNSPDRVTRSGNRQLKRSLAIVRARKPKGQINLPEPRGRQVPPGFPLRGRADLFSTVCRLDPLR